MKGCAEKNIAATQEFVRELSYAKDIQDIFRIQMEFMRSQLEAFGEQAKRPRRGLYQSGIRSNEQARP